MAKYVIEESTLKNLANAIRNVNGETKFYSPDEMIQAVTNIMETGTYVLVDEDGNEIPAVFVENKTVFTATENDIRVGTTAVTESGVTVGTKEIPSYVTLEGYRAITNNSKFLIYAGDNYDYTKLQAIICPFNKSINASVSAEKVVIDNNVYPVQSTVSESTVLVDVDNARIDLGLTNTSGKPYLIRYFTYKEIY